ncbi:glutathione S-transferase family protein [Pseudoroseicyclus sp. CXY001]|uniref:glutathione S-transferase family protein n=1 Tax=Pseudoroseicyclus sp. CXY001 TaxID=3242492 RepID=UPI0035709EB1
MSGSDPAPGSSPDDGPGDSSGGDPVVYGAPSSVYVQAVRIGLSLKGVAHRLHEVDAFARPQAEWFREISPFGKMPAFRHGTVTLYESRAILAYVDAAFAGPPLVPEDALGAARVHLVAALMDAQAYPHWVWGLYMGRDGRKPAGEMARHRAAALTLRDALNDSAGPFLAETAAPSLADCLAAPMANCLAALPEGAEILAPGTPLGRWWQIIREIPEVARHLD